MVGWLDLGWDWIRRLFYIKIKGGGKERKYLYL